jgi:hypothetical protein
MKSKLSQFVPEDGDSTDAWKFNTYPQQNTNTCMADAEVDGDQDFDI